MRRRLLASSLSITLFVLLVLEIPLGIAYGRSERRRLTNDVQHDALALSIRAEEGLERGDRAALRRLVERYQADTQGRVVVVAQDGSLLADSDPPRRGARNFTSRPEMKTALAGTENTGTRHSDTLGQTMLYFAVPVVQGNTVVGALRVTYPTSFVDGRIHRMWAVLAGGGVLVLALVFLVSLWLASQVTRPVEELERAASRLGHGDLGSRADVTAGSPELVSLARSFNQTAARLDNLVGSQEAFVADASHQLRTPLAALRLRLENAEREVEGAPAARDDIAGALAEVGRLSHLVDGLLALARAEREPPAPVRRELSEVVDERLAAWSAFAAEREVTLDAAVPAALVARSSPGRLEQVLDNLLANAIEVAPAGSLVVVDGFAQGADVVLRVVDSGRGMNADERARAFDRFWRAPDADGGTSGLGLAIVRRLVTADSGTVALEATPGGGLTVVVTLPAG